MQRTVVITGASTGIGRATALRLVRGGWTVFAGVRRERDGAALRDAAGSPALTPLIVDVTDEAQVQAAAITVSEAVGPRGLAGLVNNAGIAVAGPVESVPLDQWRRQLEINVIGQVAVIQAFLPQLRTARGAIVNVSSVGGRIALPLAGPYAASKFALEAISDALRREVSAQGITVSVVEPGGVATPIWGKAGAEADTMLDGMDAASLDRYAELTAAVRGEADRLATEGLDADVVAEVIERALTAERPRTRYLVGRDAKIQARIAPIVGDRLFDRLLARELRRIAAPRR